MPCSFLDVKWSRNSRRNGAVRMQQRTTRMSIYSNTNMKNITSSCWISVVNVSNKYVSESPYNIHLKKNEIIAVLWLFEYSWSHFFFEKAFIYLEKWKPVTVTSTASVSAVIKDGERKRMRWETKSREHNKVEHLKWDIALRFLNELVLSFFLFLPTLKALLLIIKIEAARIHLYL